MPYQPPARNRTNIQFAELGTVVDQKFEAKHDELSDCYYNFWKSGQSKPFNAGSKTFDVQPTPEQSKALFDKLHGLIFHLRDLAFHAENLKQPGNKRIAVALYNQITNESGAVIDTVSARAQHPAVINLIIRVVVIFLGLALLLFGVGDLMIPRARFVGSNPPAGALIADPPSVVITTFSNKLAPESTMDITSTIRLLPSGEMDYLDGSSVVVTSGIDPGDTSGKSMRADLRPGLHKGLYWVNWRTKSSGWRAITYGKTYFGVGMPAPENITRDMDGAIWERTYQWRSRRGALLGGLLIIALGVFLWMRK